MTLDDCIPQDSEEDKLSQEEREVNLQRGSTLSNLQTEATGQPQRTSSRSLSSASFTSARVSVKGRQGYIHKCSLRNLAYRQ